MSQAALDKLYRDVWPSVAGLPADQGLSLPLFISLPDSYSTAKLKLLIVGQETNSWYGLLGQEMGDDPVGKVLQCYRDFNLGVGYHSPFWNAVREVCRQLGTNEAPVGLAWSNVYPCDQKCDRPHEPLGQSLLDLRLLPREVEALAPDAVVFFTGPQYDGALGQLFPATNFVAVGPSDHWVHRVEHAGLPAASFRTYHPAYLQRKKKGTVLDTIAALIGAATTAAASPPVAS